MAIERGISRLVFWILMALVVVGFLQILGLAGVAEPLNEFLDGIFSYLPRLLSAGILLLLAWLIATGLRFAVRRGLAMTQLDEKLKSQIGETPASVVAPSPAPTEDPLLQQSPSTATAPKRPVAPRTLSQTLADTVYWLVFLLFLPAILDALALEGLLEPVNGLVNKVLAFLPNLLAAGLILVVGWFVARIVRRIVTNLLAATGLESFSRRIGLDRFLGNWRLSDVVGLVVYVLILIPVLIAGLNALSLEAITQPASVMLETVLEALPNIAAAAILLFLAYLLAKVVAGLATNLLSAFGFDRLIARLGLHRAAATAPDGEPASSGEPTPAAGTPSTVVGNLIIVGIMLFATIEALELVGFESLAVLVAAFTVFLGKVILALLVLALGLYLADLAARTIRASGANQADLLATVARVGIIILAGAMALRQVDVAEDIINLAFGLSLGAVAVAVAIAFGLGGRDVAARYLERWQRQSAAAPNTTPPRSTPPPPGPASV